MSEHLSDGETVNGKKEGPWTTFYANGNKRSEGAYKAGQRHGPWTYYHQTGGIDYTAEFNQGKNVGRTVSYYPNGNKECEGQFNEYRGKSSDGKKTGPWTYYAEDGKTVWRVITYKNGSRAQPDEHPLGRCPHCDKVRKTLADQCPDCGDDY